MNKIQQLICSIAKKVDDSYKISTPLLSVKLAKCVEAYPEDKTIGSMLQIIDKMESNNNLFITRADLKNLYNKLYTCNTKFSELFKDEIGNTSVKAEPKKAEEFKELPAYKAEDGVLVNALSSIFDNKEYKTYSEELGNKAKSIVSSKLDSLGLKPTTIKVDNGNDKFLIVKANYETPKGVIGLYIPVEIKNNQIIDPSIFVGNYGPEDLNHVNIKNYVIKNAGVKETINGKLILDVLNKSTSDRREISGAELSLTKLNAKRQGEFFQNQIVGQKVSESCVKDVESPKSNEFISFEKKFSSPIGIASLKFGDDKIKIAKDTIIREMLSYGHKNPQVTISGNDDNTIFCSVSLNGGRVGFIVPVKLSNNQINKPSIMMCNGSVSSLNQDNINKLFINNQSDYKAAAVASPLFDLKPSELIDNIRKAFVENNYAKAEDALNVLANSGNKEAYITGFEIFKNALNGKKEAECKCSNIIRNSTSEHPICAHTGLPIHKVYQDKQGNCRPLYRRGMSDTYDPTILMHAKVLM